LGSILVNGQEVPLVSAHVWIHRNRPGTNQLQPRPYKLEATEGIAVYPDGMNGAPRLPLLGLRSIVASKLRLTINGKDREVSLVS
jgi:hypothetical protein